MIGYQVVLNRVNTYLKKLPFWRSLTGLPHPMSSSHSQCVITINQNEATLIYAPRMPKKVDLAIFKTFEIGKNTNITTELTNIVKQYHIENTLTTLLLDSTQYQLMLIEDLPVEASEFQAAIRWKIKSSLSYPIEDAVIDNFPVPIQKSFRAQKMIMVTVAQASLLQPLINDIQKSGLNLTNITIPELALRNISVMLEPPSSSSAFLYFQKKHVDLLITNDKTLYLTRRIDFDITNSPNTDEQLEKLALEVQRSFDYYQTQWRITTPAIMAYAAIKPIAENIGEVLSTYLALPVKILDPNLLFVNRAGISIEQQYKYLPMIANVLTEELNAHATTN